MRPQNRSHSQADLWRRRSDKVLTSDVVASKNPGPAPPPEWTPALRQLSEISRAPTLAPPWWTPKTAYFGNIETLPTHEPGLVPPGILLNPIRAPITSITHRAHIAQPRR